CARLGAERARHFLLDCEHAQIPLSLVVVERDGQIAEEGEHGLLSHPESFEEVTRWSLLDPPTAARPTGRRGVGGEAGGQERFIAGDEGLTKRCGELVRSPCARLLDRRLHLQE